MVKAPHRFEYCAACTDFRDGEIIRHITDASRSRQISYRAFARNANLAPLRAAGHPALYRISAPDNWTISFHRSTLPNGARVYYFVWSRIEHFFTESKSCLLTTHPRASSKNSRG